MIVFDENLPWYIIVKQISQMYECKNRKLFDDNCSNGNVLMSSRRCDGYIECSDGSDEGEHCLGQIFHQ